MHVDDDARVRAYEGLCRRMASQVVTFVPALDFDDLLQLYRLKTWRAVQAFAPERWATRRGDAEYRFVLMCLKNLEKDLKNRVRRDVAYLEDEPTLGLHSRDAFEARLLSSSADEVYASVEEERLDLPPELSRLEAQIVVRLYVGCSQAEVARSLNIEKNAMTRAMRRIRRKLRDWRPELEPPAAELEIARAA